MENIQILVYSTLQGITEFLPISSSAHLYLLDDYFNWSENSVLLALAAHIGTLLAVVFHQRNDLIISIKKAFNTNINFQENILILSLISSFPLIFIGGFIAFFRLNDYSSNLFIIAIACIIGGIALEISDNFFKRNKVIDTISLRSALLIGLFQVLALIPGMSRSGSVITAMGFLGINRTLSIRFSLMTGVPVLFLASIFGIYEIIFNHNIFIMKFFIIVLLSLITGIFTINLLLRWIKNFSFRIFSVYRILLGTFILIHILIN